MVKISVKTRVQDAFLIFGVRFTVGWKYNPTLARVFCNTEEVTFGISRSTEWETEAYASLDQQAQALDAAEGAMGVPVPTVKVTTQPAGYSHQPTVRWGTA